MKKFVLNQPSPRVRPRGREELETRTEQKPIKRQLAKAQVAACYEAADLCRFSHLGEFEP